MKLAIIIGFTLLAFITGSAVVVGRHLSLTSPTVARKIGSPIPVRVALAKQTMLTEMLGATGEVQPIALVNLTATLSTRVEKVTVDLGDIVAPGQRLLRFDREVVEAAVATARAVMEQASADRQRAEHYLRRIVAIHTQGLLPQIEVERAQAGLDEAKAQYTKAKERLLQARKELQSVVLKSPVAGIVMERSINIGETPRSQQPLFTIGRIDHVLVAANLAEERIGETYLGQPATVTLTAFPNDAFEGKIVKMNPATDPKTRTFQVHTKIANKALKLKPGLTAFTRIKKAHHTLAVPSVCLINPTGLQESTAFVLENGSTARLRKVKIGVIAEGMTEILHGLREGEQVVVVGQLALRDGDEVVIGDEFKDLKPQVAEKRRSP
ncbi:MAG: efflux RND transporter periplasmic adaptor subunit [Candidatus Entotheonellia bacterium]